MRILAVSSSLVLLGAFLAIAYVLLVEPGPPSRGHTSDLEVLLSTVPSIDRRNTIARSVRPLAVELEAAHGSWLGRKREALRPLWDLAVLRVTAAMAFLPSGLAMMGTALAVGLSRRERAKLTFAYCSTTWSYLGKHAVAFALGGYIVAACCPIGLPLWTLYAFATMAALGAGLYAAHLPPKI